MVFFKYDGLTMQLDKILQSQGFGSRKQCQKLILTGAVQINGEVCTDIKYTVKDAELKHFNFSIYQQNYQYYQHIYIALYKPKHYECSHQPDYHHSVFDLLPSHFIQRNIQSVGRLDQDTTGLLLLTDDGKFLHQMTHPRQHIAKRYRVTVENAISTQDIAQLKQGVHLHHETGLFCADDIELKSENCLEFTIYQGIYHQVKRMLASIGHKVVALHRTQIGHLLLEDLMLHEKQWCYLTEQQLALMKSK